MVATLPKQFPLPKANFVLLERIGLSFRCSQPLLLLSLWNLPSRSHLDIPVQFPFTRSLAAAMASTPYYQSHEDVARAQIAVEFVLESVKLILLLKSVTLVREMNEIESLYKNLKFLQIFIRAEQESSKPYSSFPDLVVEIREVLDQLLAVIDSGIYRNQLDTSRFLLYSPRVAELDQKIIISTGEIIISSGPNNGGGSSSSGSSQGQPMTSAVERIIVGFEDRIVELRDKLKLIQGSNQLKVILLVGKSRLDETRLGGKVWNDLSIGRHFLICASTSISQVYEKKILLHDILRSILGKYVSFLNRTAEDIGEELHKFLKGNRYLVVIDGIRDIQVWSDLATYFPNDGNGSRILMTSQILDVVKDTITDHPCHSLHFRTREECLDLFTSEEFSDKSSDLVGEMRSTSNGGSSSESSSSQPLTSAIVEKIVVGFEDETRELLEKLIGRRKQLEVIPIVGMAGIGKTTLANKLYNDSPIAYHFHTRAWTSISQVYEKRKSLHSILNSILNKNDPVFHMSTEDIGEKLYKCLKGNRYLIVIDDIWDIQVWNDLKIYFPNDGNGSRILMTSRIVDVVANACTDSPPAPHFLRFLSQKESWDLFTHKVFSCKSFPEELVNVGEQIVAKCKGLPLAIVILAGYLAQREKREDLWRQVAESVGSSVNSDLGQLMDILALSYTDLPPALKCCFLHLGSFPEDYEIPVKDLVRSWIAEGFIKHSSQKLLEHAAESCLINLINRSLVTVAKKRSDGGIKSCYIHDLLRDFVIKKGKERKLLQLICKCKSNVSSISKSNVPHSYDDPYPIHKFSDCQYFHSYKGCYVTAHRICNEDTFAVYKLLRVLNLRHIRLDKIPEKILELLHLKFLALWVDRYDYLPRAILKLWNLETLILDGDKAGTIELPVHILKMVCLRHVKISKELFCQAWDWERHHFPASVPENLQTLSKICPSGSFHILLAKTRCLRKLGLHLTFSDNGNPSVFPDLFSMFSLEKLKFEYQTLGMVPFHIQQPFPPRVKTLRPFPPGLKRLTLVGSYVKWEEMSIIGLLPLLEVLKIKDNFFSGATWETSEKSFRNLKFLKLSHLDLQQWISCSSHFPILEHLVLNGCLDLQEIPPDFGEIPTLLTIEVYRSSESSVESAKQIQEIQCDLKVLIYHQFQEF